MVAEMSPLEEKQKILYFDGEISYCPFIFNLKDS